MPGLVLSGVRVAAGTAVALAAGHVVSSLLCETGESGIRWWLCNLSETFRGKMCCMDVDLAKGCST